MPNPESQAVAPTNHDVAERIGLTHSGVSRIRSGDRFPSLPLMGRIEAAYGWTIQAQAASRANGTYAADFERALVGDVQS